MKARSIVRSSRILCAVSAGAALVVAALASCSESGSATSPTTPDASPEATVETGTSDAGSDAGTLIAKCTGDEARCLRGVVRAKGFSAALTEGAVTAWPQFPFGRVTPISSATLEADGSFAISGIPDGEHVFLSLSSLTFAGSGTSDAAWLLGPYVVPASREPLTLEPTPFFVQALQATGGDAGGLGWSLATLEKKAGGGADEGATVGIDLQGGSTPMPFGPTPFGISAYFVGFRGDAGAQPPAQASFQVHATGGTLGADKLQAAVAMTTPKCVPEITSPADNATVTMGQQLTVEWKADARCDYAYVEIVDDTGASPVVAGSLTGLGPSDTKVTVPASTLTTAGAHRVRLVMATATCDVMGCGFHAVQHERVIDVQ